MLNHNFTKTIAEAGINHGGDLKKAKLLIEAAARAGYDFIKFQTYKTETRLPKSGYKIFDILKENELKYEDFSILKKHAEDNNIIFCSTVFDVEDYDFLKSINCKYIKISSFDLTNKKLLRHVARDCDTVFLSTGMSNLNEIKESYSIFNKENLKLLHCVSSYPLEDNKSNLLAIKTLKKNFNCEVGYSDHSQGIKLPLYATLLGAEIIEKHFKIDNDCVDSVVSINEEESKKMISEIKEIEKILGNGKKGCEEVENSSKIFRKFS